MRLLCVQCLKVNDVPEEADTDADGKMRVVCDACGFVTVITRRAPGQKPTPARTPAASASSSSPPQQKDVPTAEHLYDDLFNTENEVGDWMVRHLDGTEVGPLSFDQIRDMISSGQLGKIDEVRKMDERYVPAAFHEATAELFNELETTGI